MFKKEKLLLGLLVTTATAVLAIPAGILTGMAAQKKIEEKKAEDAAAGAVK